ncbi:hypothetical protein [Sandaracinobacteroides saxicola]|uniref:DUF2333 family protein n=1 Tax=Sandaracinobacteroides saxicola TaxID=2759707 RepID=A0A7G5IM03_9SPHN|nr:hypothetical protein [Sandaracinobacteroides saxicola]QMW24395.1 hypothetical protein H3309_08075 [Sandaracinobacteroides saxicola]
MAWHHRIVFWRARNPDAPRKPLPRWLLAGAALVAALLLWFGVGGLLLHDSRGDIALRPGTAQLPAGGSATVAMAARLLQSQTEDRAFTPDDPWFFPSALLRATPRFQKSVVAVVAAWVTVASTASSDPDLAAAAQSLAVVPDQWWLQLRWPPFGRPSAHHYADAQAALERLNARLSASPPAPRRAADLASATATLAALVEAEAARGDALIRGGGGSISAQLAGARGTAFAAAMLLRGLRDDNALLIRGSGRAARWNLALDALDEAAALDPLFPGRADLVQSGYQLLQAARALREAAA